MVDDLQTVAAHKNPSVRAESLLWLARSIQARGGRFDRAEIGRVCKASLAMSDDGATEVRDASIAVLATMYHLAGEKAMAPFLQDMDKMRRDKMVEASGRLSEGDGGERSVSVAAVPVVEGNSGLGRKASALGSASGIALPNFKRGAAAVPAKKAVDRLPPGGGQAAGSSGSGPAGGGQKMVDLNRVEFEYSEEQAAARMEEALDQATCLRLAEKNWKTRLEGMSDFAVRIKDAGQPCEAVVRFLLKTPGSKESNFQVY